MGGRRHRRRGRLATTDPDAATALLEQTATDLPDAGAELRGIGKVDCRRLLGHGHLDRHLGPRRRTRLELLRPPCNLREDGDAWQVVAEPTLVHPELGTGSTWC